MSPGILNPTATLALSLTHSLALSQPLIHPNTRLYFHVHFYVCPCPYLDSIIYFHVDAHIYCDLYLFRAILPISLVLRKCLLPDFGNVSLGEQLAIAMLSQLSYNSVSFL
jgi:hypothetical protein